MVELQLSLAVDLRLFDMHVEAGAAAIELRSPDLDEIVSEALLRVSMLWRETRKKFLQSGYYMESLQLYLCSNLHTKI